MTRDTFKAKGADPEVLLRYTDSELMKELERRFMDINNLEGNKIWAWMNNYSCGHEVMSMMTKRGQLRRERSCPGGPQSPPPADQE